MEPLELPTKPKLSIFPDEEPKARGEAEVELETVFFHILRVCSFTPLQLHTVPGVGDGVLVLSGRAPSVAQAWKFSNTELLIPH